MKKLLIQIGLCIILGAISFNAVAQQRIDSTTAKIKLDKFQSQVKNSKIATFVGLGLIPIGVALAAGYSSDDGIVYTGIGIAGCGAVISTVSGIHWGVGKRKVREYQIRLDDARTGAYFSPNQVGFKLAFKF